MAVFRVNKTDDYTVMSNQHLKDGSLSLKAKGLLSLMLSLPDDWDYTIAGLCSICVENESAVKSTLKELKERGYLRIDKIMPGKSASGRIEYVYNVFEQACKKQEVEKQPLEKQGVEILPVEVQAVENPGQSNTKELNTNQSNTKNNIPPVTTNVVTSPKGEAPTLIDKDKYNNNIHNAYTSLSKGGVGESLSLDAAEPTCEPPAAAIPQKKPAPIDERFEQFWVVYPRKIGKGAARKAFEKIKPNDELLKRMVVAVVAQSKSTAWTDEGGRYIPSPSRWLNEERWGDEIVQTRKHDYAERQVKDSDFDDGFFVDLMSREPRKTSKKDGGGK